jgi:signal transduction histidine kinase
VEKARPPQRSVTVGLLVGLAVTLAAVAAYSWYVTRQIHGLRRLQTQLVERSRKDSLQLLRIQNDLNLIAVAMRDMLDNDEPYPLNAWEAQFRRIRGDLEDALRAESAVAIADRTPEQRAYLGSSVAQFWDAMDRMFTVAKSGNDTEARSQIRLSLQARQAALSGAVARLLIENNENEERAAASVSAIYDRVQRQAYVFLLATLIAIVITTILLIRWNRQLFAHLADISQQRSELAQKLITTQETTLRYISRELHDEFGQILTAIGSMLTRAGKRGDPVLRADLREVADVAQSALDKVRTLSQALHPVILEEAGLEQALDWYVPTVQRQSGLTIEYDKRGTPFPVDSTTGVHVYRLVQEALNNAVRHSGADKAWVRLRYLDDGLEVEVEDHGKGFSPNGSRGIGLIGMRERAELIGGMLQVSPADGGGTLVRLRVPRTRIYAEPDHSIAR